MSGGAMAEDEFGAETTVDAEALGADGHAAIGADFDGGAEAPDKRPPGAARDGAEEGAFLLEGEVPGRLGFHLKFSVDFVLVAMKAQALDMGIGLVDVGDLLAGEIGGQAFLPKEVATFDFTFKNGVSHSLGHFRQLPCSY